MCTSCNEWYCRPVYVFLSLSKGHVVRTAIVAEYERNVLEPTDPESLAGSSTLDRMSNEVYGRKKSRRDGGDLLYRQPCNTATNPTHTMHTTWKRILQNEHILLGQDIISQHTEKFVGKMVGTHKILP